MSKRFNNITEVEKADHIEEVQKFNPYHGKDGRFTSAGGGGGMAGPMMAPDGKGGTGGAGGGKITSPSQLKTGETYELRDQLTGQTVVGTGKYEGRVGSENGPELHQFDMGTNKAIYTKDQIESGTVSRKGGSKPRTGGSALFDEKNKSAGIYSIKAGKGKKGEEKARKLAEEAKASAKEHGKDPRGVHLAINGAGEWSVDYIGGSGYFG